MTRSFKHTAGYLILFSCFISIGPAQAQHSHGHGHAEHGAMQLELELNHGRRRATDAPLRQAMERVRADVAMARQADLQGRFKAPQAQELAAGLDAAIAYMVQQCRLEPKADANLHILLGRLSGAASAIKANPQAANGLPQMLEVLDIYPRHFTHPGWKAIGH